MMKFSPVIERSKTTKPSITTLWIASLAFAMTMGEVVSVSLAAPANVDFTITTSEAVNVTGCPVNCPRIAVTVDGQTRYAQYSAGTGSSSLTFTYAPTLGDLDLDGVTLTSPIDLNGGTITDLNGNPQTDLTFTVPDTSGIKIDYPSLSMDFVADADGRYTLDGTAYNDLSSFLGAAGGSFTRNSIATYFDSTGTLQTAAANQPRFDYDPVTHTPKGILIEQGFTNGLRNSENFSVASDWTTTNITLDSTYISPTGNTGATKLIADTSNALHNLTSTLAGGSNAVLGQPIIASAFVKSGEYNRIRLELLPATIFPLVAGVQTPPSITVNTSTGTIISSANTSSASIQALPNGWYRVFWGRTTMNANTVRVRATLQDNSGNTTFTGDGTSGVLLWGYQLNINIPHPVSYMPSNGSWGTHSKDELILPLNSWYNQSAQTLWGKGYSNGVSSGSGSTLADIDNNDWSERFQIRFQGGPLYGGIITQSGNLETVINGGSYTFGQEESAVMAGQNNDVALSSNGAIIATDSAITMPSAATQLRVGSVSYGFEFLNGSLSGLKYYPSRVSNTQLQLLTQ
ncbi:MAG: hypothetical protein PHX61_03565 [Alphaproteobacteria bacterium]|nr:hypothetical protein [Alphaproteobacteria bacterium]